MKLLPMHVAEVAGESGADMYDAEMKSYLCSEDIAPKPNTCLDAFLHPGQTRELAGKRKREEEDTTGPPKKVYKSDTLPGL